MQESEFQDLLKISEDIAKYAAEEIRLDYSKWREIDINLPRDVKVKADQFLDEIVRKKLKDKTEFPIISEEKIDSHKMGDGYQWIVDPLDGSLNFSRSIPISCISIALWNGLEPLLGVIYDFNKNECFSGAVKSKCELNNKKITPSIVKEKSEAILATGFPSKTEYTTNSLIDFVEDIRKFKKIRLLGSAALSLAYVACGRIDIYQENNIKIWDVAAGLALIKSAGGIVKFSPPKNDMTLRVQASNKYILKKNAKSSF